VGRNNNPMRTEFPVKFLILGLLAISLVSVTAIAADEPQVELEAASDETGNSIYFQFAWLYRFADTSTYPTKSWPQWSTDVGFTFAHNEAGCWGTGLRLSLDVDGSRWGVGGLRKWWLGGSKKSYLQVNPGILVAANDQYLEPKLPGWYVEVEVGWRSLAWVTEYQSLPFKSRWGGFNTYGQNPNLPDEFNGIQTSWLTGVQMSGGLGAGLITGTLLTVLIVSATVSVM